MGYAQANRVDVIIAGSVNLTATSLFARISKKVLVLESHDLPGGYVHGFRRKRFVFDASVLAMQAAQQALNIREQNDPWGHLQDFEAVLQTQMALVIVV